MNNPKLIVSEMLKGLSYVDEKLEYFSEEEVIARKKVGQCKVGVVSGGGAGRLRGKPSAPAGAGLRPGGALCPRRGRPCRACPHPETAGFAGRDEHPDAPDRPEPHPLPQAGRAAGPVPAVERPLLAGQCHRPAPPLRRGDQNARSAVHAG